MTPVPAPPARPTSVEGVAPETTDSASRLRFVVTRMHRLLRQHAAGDLTLTQASTLATVARFGPLTLGELAGREQVAPPTITNVVGKLEAAGLVDKAIDANDRRVCRVSLTPAGRARLDEIRDLRTAWLTGRLADLSIDDRARVVDALEVLEQLVTEASPS